LPGQTHAHDACCPLWVGLVGSMLCPADHCAPRSRAACFNGKPAVASLELAQWYNYTLPAGSWLYFTGAVQLTGGLGPDDAVKLTVSDSVLSFADDEGVVRGFMCHVSAGCSCCGRTLCRA